MRATVFSLDGRKAKPVEVPDDDVPSLLDTFFQTNPTGYLVLLA